MQLTILIPALNEEETIPIVIKKGLNFLKEHNIDGEVLVINNSSTDNTKEVAIQNGARVEDEEKKGYGSALISGINKAKGEFIIMGDADDSYNFSEIEGFYDGLKEGYDLIIGNRFYHMEKGAMKFTHRYIGTPMLNLLIRLKYKTKIKDINCGLRGLRRESFVNLGLQCSGMEFASEMVIKAIKNNLKIKQIDINFYKDARNKKGHLNAIRDGLRHVKVILKG